MSTSTSAPTVGAHVVMPESADGTNKPNGNTHTMTDATSHTIDATVAAVGSKATYTGAGMTISGWILSSEFAVLVGMVIGVAGFIVNWYYKHKLTTAEIRLREEQAERERIEHQYRMGQY